MHVTVNIETNLWHSFFLRR